jgi:hypothetical protein
MIRSRECIPKAWIDMINGSKARDFPALDYIIQEPSGHLETISNMPE